MSGCKTCRYAEFERTPTGRIKKGEAGRCTFVIGELPPLPISVRDFRWPPSRAGIWADMGEGCPVYEPVEAMP